MFTETEMAIVTAKKTDTEKEKRNRDRACLLKMFYRKAEAVLGFSES